MKPPRGCLTTVLKLAESIHLIEGSSMARARLVTVTKEPGWPLMDACHPVPPSLRKAASHDVASSPVAELCFRTAVKRASSRQQDSTAHAPCPQTLWRGKFR